SSCETDTVNAMSVPIGTIIGSHSRAVPTVTEARVWVPWRPAMTLSTKPIRPVDTWPSTSGRASVAVASSSWPKRRSGWEEEDMGMRREAAVVPGALAPGSAGWLCYPHPAAATTPCPKAIRATAPTARPPLHGEYCHLCGQHAHNPVRSFAHAVEEVFESFWHLDGRIFRTVRRLLAPGRLAEDYLHGRRAPYVAPMRLFVVLCVLTFFVGRGVIHFGDDGSGDAAVKVQMVDQGVAQATTAEEVE